jgi:hypothetical protein
MLDLSKQILSSQFLVLIRRDKAAQRQRARDFRERPQSLSDGIRLIKGRSQYLGVVAAGLRVLLQLSIGYDRWRAVAFGGTFLITAPAKQ